MAGPMTHQTPPNAPRQLMASNSGAIQASNAANPSAGSHFQGRSTRRWTPEEELTLRGLVEETQENWDIIAQRMPTRSRKSIRDRWKHIQSIASPDQWNPEEEFQLACWHAWLGPCWDKMASLAGGRRTKEQIIHYWGCLYYSSSLQTITTRPLAVYMRLLRAGAPPDKTTLVKAQKMVHATLVSALNKKTRTSPRLNSSSAKQAAGHQAGHQQSVAAPVTPPLHSSQAASPAQGAQAAQANASYQYDIFGDDVDFDSLFKDDLDDLPALPAPPGTHPHAHTSRPGSNAHGTGALGMDGVNVMDLDDDLDLLETLLKDVGVDDPFTDFSHSHHHAAGPSRAPPQQQSAVLLQHPSPTTPATPATPVHAQVHGHGQQQPAAAYLSRQAPALYTNALQRAAGTSAPQRTPSGLSDVMDSLAAERGQRQLLPPPSQPPAMPRSLSTVDTRLLVPPPQGPHSATTVPLLAYHDNTARDPAAHGTLQQQHMSGSGAAVSPSQQIPRPGGAAATPVPGGGPHQHSLATTSAPAYHHNTGSAPSSSPTSSPSLQTIASAVPRMPAHLAFVRHLATLQDLRRWGSGAGMELCAVPSTSPRKRSATEHGVPVQGQKRSIDNEWSSEVAANMRAKRTSSGPYTPPYAKPPGSPGSTAVITHSMATLGLWSHNDLRHMSQRGGPESADVSSPEMDALFP